MLVWIFSTLIIAYKLLCILGIMMNIYAILDLSCMLKKSQENHTKGSLALAIMAELLWILHLLADIITK